MSSGTRWVQLEMDGQHIIRFDHFQIKIERYENASAWTELD
jgi:hypothetical protein